jgi:DNA-binding HxlR family transcriptional regulator
MSTTSLNDLIMLGKQRWMAAMLADLSAHHGARFVELVNRLSLPRDTLARTLEAGQALGWVIRNPGHGHPLRPEYILTDVGARIAGIAQSQLQAQRQIGLPPGTLTRWGLPILHSLDGGFQRFNDLFRALTPASPRALSDGLRVLATNDLIMRRLVDDYPPISLYSLTKNGLILARAA